MIKLWNKSISFGDIISSKLWLSIGLHRTHGYHISFGPTYYGTIAGIVICFGPVSLIAHIRE